MTSYCATEETQRDPQLTHKYANITIHVNFTIMTILTLFNEFLLKMLFAHMQFGVLLGPQLHINYAIFSDLVYPLLLRFL